MNKRPEFLLLSAIMIASCVANCVDYYRRSTQQRCDVIIKAPAGPSLVQRPTPKSLEHGYPRDSTLTIYEYRDGPRVNVYTFWSTSGRVQCGGVEDSEQGTYRATIFLDEGQYIDEFYTKRNDAVSRVERFCYPRKNVLFKDYSSIKYPIGTDASSSDWVGANLP